MIKKNTTVIFEEGGSQRTEELKGGMPLSEGEIVNFHKNGEIIEYKVVKKEIDYHDKGEDQIVNVTYTLRKES